jgi:hypothetical protein
MMGNFENVFRKRFQSQPSKGVSHVSQSFDSVGIAGKPYLFYSGL